MRKSILHVEENFGDSYCCVLQHITLHFSELQFIAVLFAELTVKVCDKAALH